DEAYDNVLEAQALRIESKEELDIFPQIDNHMDLHQEKAYALIREVIEELQEKDPALTSKLRQALQCFDQAEILESLNEDHISKAANAVDKQEKPLDEASQKLDRMPRKEVMS
ncbi:MAG: hypothetical protein GY852_00655, partial [bacterium]|nr:hypothetical protein [bacterium]